MLKNASCLFISHLNRQTEKFLNVSLRLNILVLNISRIARYYLHSCIKYFSSESLTLFQHSLSFVYKMAKNTEKHFLDKSIDTNKSF